MWLRNILLTVTDIVRGCKHVTSTWLFYSHRPLAVYLQTSQYHTLLRPLETASHRGVALLRLEHHWLSSSTVACSTMRVCPCKRRPLWAQTVTDVFVYELLRRLFHIGNFCFWVLFLKQLLLRNCAVDFVEICNFYVEKMIIKAAKRILNSDKICRSYSDLNFGVTL